MMEPDLPVWTGSHEGHGSGVGRLEPGLILLGEIEGQRLDFAVLVHVPAIRSSIDSRRGRSREVSVQAEGVNRSRSVSAGHPDVGAIGGDAPGL